MSCKVHFRVVFKCDSKIRQFSGSDAADGTKICLGITLKCHPNSDENVPLYLELLH
uniref:Uncharacterized protein n=1 Tax=Anguilla anguilla TaxID=7936 RepID=A0A0E9QZ74_ANGAN